MYFETTNEIPKTGTYTVMTVTNYSNGHAEVQATTIKDPETRTKRMTRDELHTKIIESPALTGEKAAQVLESFFDSPSPQKTVLELKENRERSLRRTKSLLRKKIIEGNFDRLLTLTYRENKESLEDAWNDWKRFIRLLKKSYPTIKYVVVAERQKRGAIHFHVALDGYFNVNTLRHKWLTVIKDGNIDIKKKKNYQTLFSLATYLTKYLTKQKDSVEPFKNLYRSSQNLKYKQIKFYMDKSFAMVRQEAIEQEIKMWISDIQQVLTYQNGLTSGVWAISLPK